MRWRWASLTGALQLLASSLAAFAAPALIGSEWAVDPVWDDGLAEVAKYDASRIIYGKPRPYEAVLITVKEDLDARQLVKAEPPFEDRPLLSVLKQNAVREIATPNYPYRIMTSTFVERRDPTRLLKLTSGSHEWCGNTWKALRLRDGRLHHTWESYFDGEGDGRQDLDHSEGDLLEDQLPLALRGLRFEPGTATKIRLLPSFAASHGGPVHWTEAELRIVGSETLELEVGRVESWRVHVHRADEYELELWFGTSGTHPLLKLESSAGESLCLKSLERRAYWRRPPGS